MESNRMKWLLVANLVAALVLAAFAIPENAVPHVDTNAALQAFSTLSASKVVRDGYAATGDAAPLTYTASGGACSLNAGAGDGGLQVPSADGKCWLANLKGHAFVNEWGADMTGTNDATSAAQACLNAVGSGGVCGVDLGGSLKLLG